MQKWLFGVFGVLLGGIFFFSWQSHQKLVLLTEEVVEEAEVEANTDSSLCKSLRSIPLADATGIIVDVREIALEGVAAPHNASIVEDGEGFLMVFRYDQKQRREVLGVKTPFRKKIAFGSQKMPFRTFIGSVRLDRDFRQISPVKRIETGSDFSEDPRIFRVGSEVYVSYNDMQDHEISIRSMRLAKIDPVTLQTQFITDVDQQISFIDRTSHVEKNWTPFVRQEEGRDRICFGYSINPHKIMKMKDPQNSELEHPIYPARVSFQKMPWDEKRWGTLRGGTPAILVDGQYLSFFHTLFFADKRPWYVMGAYTFEADPPYRVTAVSQKPILFKEIYQTKAMNTAYSKKRAFFPAGLVLGKKEGRDVLYVSSGENDCTIKVLTFDKEALLQSLTSIPLNQKEPRLKDLATSSGGDS